MNTEISDDVDVVRKLKKVKCMTSTIRKKLEDCVFAKNLYCKTSQETNEKLQCDSFISEDSSTVQDLFIKKVSSLSKICNKALEKDMVQIKEDNVYEKFYDSSSSPILNSKYCDGNEGAIRIKQAEHGTQSEKLRTIFSQELENFANYSAKNINSFVATHSAVENEHLKIEKTSDEDAVKGRILLENLNGTDITINSLESFENEELQPDRLIMVEIYRRISSFFEIGIVTPVAMVIENHFEIFEFGLAIIVCTIYMFFTNAEKEFKKNLSSRMKKNDSYAKSHMSSESSTVTSCQPVKTSDSMEPLIILKSNNNSKEELNMPCETELNNNVDENNSVKQTLTDSRNPKYGNEPSNCYEFRSCEEKMPQFKDLDAFDSLLLTKCKMYPNYLHTEIQGATRDNRASEDVDKNDEKLEEKVVAGGYFTEISGLDLKNELVEESSQVFNKETNIPESPSKEGFSSTIPWKDLNTLLKEIDLIEFGNQPESFHLLVPINDKKENIAKTEKLCNLSDISQLSNSFSAEPILLDMDGKLLQKATQLNEKNVETKQEFEEILPIFFYNPEQDIFSENSEVKYESINITPLLSNNLAAKTVCECGQMFLDFPRSGLEDHSNLSLCDEYLENNLEIETIPDGNKVESFSNEREDKNEANALCQILIGDSSICKDQDNNNVVSLVPETSSECDTSYLNNAAYDNKANNKILTESTEVPILIIEPKITACTLNNFEVGENNFENILPKTQDLDSIKINYNSNNSSQQPCKDDYSKCNELLVEDCIECIAMEELNNENLTCEKVIHFPEYDPIEECETTFKKYTHIVEYVEGKDLNLTEIQTKNEPKLNEIVKLEKGEEINNSYPICNIEQLGNENCNRNSNQNKIHKTLQYTQALNDASKDSLDVNGPLQCLEYTESSEDNIQRHSYDIVIETRSFDTIQITQEKSIDIYKSFSSSMPDVRCIDEDELVSCKMDTALKYPDIFLPSDLDGTCAHELSETSFSCKLSPFLEEKGIKGCFQNVPRICYPLSVKNSEEDPNEDFQCLTSCASEHFEMESSSSIHNNEVTNYASEVKEDSKTHEDSQCLLYYFSRPYETEAPSSSSNNVVANFASDVKADGKKLKDFQCLPSSASESFEMEAQSSSSNNAAANFASEVKADRKKHEKQKSFRSKVSSMFNGAKKLHGRMLKVAGEYGNYKK